MDLKIGNMRDGFTVNLESPNKQKMNMIDQHMRDQLDKIDRDWFQIPRVIRDPSNTQKLEVTHRDDQKQKLLDIEKKGEKAK